MNQIQQNYLIGRLWQLGKSNKYIQWELRLLAGNREGDVSDDTANIMTSQEYLVLEDNLINCPSCLRIHAREEGCNE